MTVFFSSNLFKILSFISLAFSILGLISILVYFSKKRHLKNNPKKVSKKNSKQEEVLNIEISDLQIKLDLKKAFEEELIKTIHEAEATKNYNTKQLLNDLKLKIQNLNEIDKRNLTDSTNALEDREIFHKDLERTHPELTYHERELCTYFRLNLSSKEIAVIENITHGTVRVYKNKIKNKIGLSLQEDLNEYLISLSKKK